ncbi:hypothetical protein BD408DRAFT_56744 [Parasitella parasitica]|nr:hypothetical protein BD408DRAFT_56744 [Parasitella parasitica]
MHPCLFFFFFFSAGAVTSRDRQLDTVLKSQLVVDTPYFLSSRRKRLHYFQLDLFQDECLVNQYSIPFVKTRGFQSAAFTRVNPHLFAQTAIKKISTTAFVCDIMAQLSARGLGIYCNSQ